MSAATQGAKPYYFVPQPSPWPIFGACALLLMGTGAAFWFNGYEAGPWLCLAGFCVLVYMMFHWFGRVIGESEGRLYNKKVDISFRWSMSWFIFSEVMFFGAFFGALFYVRMFSVPWLGGEGHGVLTHQFLWSDYTAAWGAQGGNGPARVGGPFEIVPAWGLPLLNTLILLSSSVTVTIAHHALRAGRRGRILVFLGLTVVLGALFLPGLSRSGSGTRVVLRGTDSVAPSF